MIKSKKPTTERLQHDLTPEDYEDADFLEAENKMLVTRATRDKKREGGREKVDQWARL